MMSVSPRISPPDEAGAAPPLDIRRLREDFPVLHLTHRGKPLIYLDNAATSQKPRQVIDRLRQYYEGENANVHRGIHYLSQRATDAYEGARTRIARFFNAPSPKEIVFTKGCTDAINLVAQSYGRRHLKPGDEVLITHLEHHSNIVPWQLICEEKGARLRVAPIDDNGNLLVDDFEALLSSRTKIVAVSHVSNALGTINPVRDLTAMAHAAGAVVLVDGAQAAPHMRVDVQDIGCDFYAVSAHKMFGPTGIGVLYGRADLLDAMPPYQGGGDMIVSVTFEKTTFNTLPYKFEAGTPNIAGAIGFGAAVDYIENVGLDRIEAYEAQLLDYGTRLLSGIDGLRLVGQARERASVLSFDVEGAHPHDVGQLLDEDGIAIRAGHHCAQPVMQRFGLSATARASLAFYNTREELDALATALDKAKRFFA